MFSGGRRGQEVAECDTCGSLALSGSVAVSGRQFTDSIYNTMDQHWSLLPPDLPLLSPLRQHTTKYIESVATYLLYCSLMTPAYYY